MNAHSELAHLQIGCYDMFSQSLNTYPPDGEVAQKFFCHPRRTFGDPKHSPQINMILGEETCKESNVVSILYWGP